jgi:hypothetical protein
MFLKVKEVIINTDHIIYAEWRKINVGSPSETHNLLIYFTAPSSNSSLNLREDEEVKKLWRYLEEQAQVL